jgi:hypothetical protein
MSFISAQKLYQNEEFVGGCPAAIFNSNLVSGQPRQAWIYPNGYSYWILTFVDPLKSDALTGTWITENGVGILLDGTVDSVATALSACCGDDPVEVTPVYDGVYPSVVDPIVATYTITRVDDGSVTAMQDFMLAYSQWIISDATFQRSGYNSGTGVSTYVFTAYKDPFPQGNDIITGETARVYSSNAPGALTGGQTYGMDVFHDGDAVGGPITGAASLAAVVTAATADAVLGAYGTWSTAGGKILLTTTTTTGISITVNREGV